MYEHFMLLYGAITILCDPDLCLTKNLTAEAMLFKFVEESPEVYGIEFVVSVIHNLVHLAESVRQQKAPLNNFSTFPFESFMIAVKKCIHTPNKPLHQINARILEMLQACSLKSVEFEESGNMNSVKLGKHLSNALLESVTIGGVIINPSTVRDKFMLTQDRKVVECWEIVLKDNCPLFVCKELKQKGNFFETPLKATCLDYFWCAKESLPEKLYLELGDFNRKLFAMPLDSSSLTFAPLRKFLKM